jgi:hypothetical protein
MERTLFDGLKFVYTVFVALIGAVVAVFIFLDLSPRIRLRLLPATVDQERRRYVLRMEIENVSKVAISQNLHKGCLLQMLEHSIDAHRNMSEFVPFSRETYEKRPSAERAKEWREPVPVFESTRLLYPGDLVIIERLLTIPDDQTFLHVGLQFHGEIGRITRLALGIQSMLTAEPTERWTTTCFIFPPLKK